MLLGVKEENMGSKTIAVRYLSRGGNTKKLADAIAQAAGVKAESIPSPLEQKTDVLFLGAAVYWGGIDGKMKEYIRSLEPEKVGKVVVFSNSSLTERAYPGIRKLLDRQGIRTEDDNFYCRGQFRGLYKGRPNADDLKEAAAFAGKYL